MNRRVMIALARLGLLAALLAAWQFLPRIPALRARWRFFDPVFISSPAEVARDVYRLATGTGGLPQVFPYLGHTLEATLIGAVVGLALGITGGLLASSYTTVSEIVWPFVVAANSVPRIALVPIVVLVVGPTTAGAAISAVLIVFFIGFFNALEGGRAVPQRLVENARLMGAGPLQQLRHLRLPHVLSWAFAAVPNAISLSLIAVVTTEILTGVPGMGSLIQQATTTLDAGLTFAIVVILAVVGLALILLAQLVRDRVIRWPL